MAEQLPRTYASVAASQPLVPASPTILDPDHLLDPPRVVKAIKAGMKQYIPLTALTNAACRTAYRTAHKGRDTVRIENGVLTATAKEFDASRELHLTTEEFREAWPRLVRLVRDHHPHAERELLADDFHGWFNLITTKPKFSMYPGLFIALDVAVRRSWTARPIKLNFWQEELYREHMQDFLLAKAAGTVDERGYPVETTHGLTSTSNAGPSGAGGRADTGFPGAGGRADAGRPPARSQGQSFREPQRAQSPARRMEPLRWCFLCGLPFHGEPCRNDNPPYLKRGESGLVQPDGSRLCVKFNKFGCRGSCRLAHVCSLCGKEHGAQHCPRHA
ncbi:hypothetical protein EVJ58_g8154 [Rhodofomes roseus]|uniref:Uncharacterized protein n=1 Tax=Rhodofomes roseus TaxID=34475 RepID=A0A4Y9Y0N3_9APHY|nr:hypothetical protein EVJ58_g8154 [Rhodofomes roseus]